MAKKKGHDEEHVDETWLIPYADMLTLLLALFIVMFAMSKMDQQKFEQVANQFNVIFAGGSGLFDESGKIILPANPSGSQGESGSKSEKTLEEDIMTDIRRKIESEIRAEGLGDKVNVELTEEGLEVSIQDAVLFQSGDATIEKESSPILTHIALMIGGIDNKVKVIGHTDNQPTNSAKFRSNWELSATRAINVMLFLVDVGDLKEERFSIQGYGEYSPQYDNSSEKGRSKNRRVEIVILRKFAKSGSGS